MSYRKFCVDNPVCMRRFHLAYDDETPQQRTELRCPHCQALVFEDDAHPRVRMLREENLTKVSAFSDNIMRSCEFKDKFVCSQQ
ncbi:MAG: hypothetical protein OYH77_06310 [Pseudomonadota bacterium]|nr:hypothetical protein [Pseudomonadota bacterium]